MILCESAKKSTSGGRNRKTPEREGSAELESLESKKEPRRVIWIERRGKRHPEKEAEVMVSSEDFPQVFVELPKPGTG